MNLFRGRGGCGYIDDVPTGSIDDLPIKKDFYRKYKKLIH